MNIFLCEGGCGRSISHRGFCLPCNKKKKMDISRSKIVCASCGFHAAYNFLRCPECGHARFSGSPEPMKDYAKPKSRISIFPFSTVRQSQKEMVDDVKKTVSAGRHLVADAPTGLGKTAASLFPALEYATANGKTVFFLTSRLSQHKAAIETLKKIKEAGNQLSAIDIIGKRHLCSQEVEEMTSGVFNSYCRAMVKDKRCTYFKNSNSQALAGERSNIINILSSSIPSTEEALNLASARYCTYEMLMDSAKHADAIVGDYFHLFGMGDAFLKRMSKQLSDIIIIVDEAHNLSSRMRSHLSLGMSTWECDLAAKEAQDYTEFEAKSIAKDVGKALQNIAKKNLIGKKEAFVQRASLVDYIGDYDAITAKLAEIGSRVLEEKKVSHIDKIAEFLQDWKKDDFGYARIISRQSLHDKDHIILNFNCMDPSLISKGIINDSHSTILMSGTLSPMEMHRDLLGLSPGRTDMKSYASPFPKENRKNIISTGTTTMYKERSDENIRRIAKQVSDCVNSIKGNAAVFFPSYDMRNKICNILSTRKHMILEKSEMTKRDRDKVKEEMKQHKETGAILFAVLGGSFSEGIDLPGDLLNGVVIVGLPLERPTLSTDALIDYYEKRFGRGRDYGYNFPAMIKVMQAAGRCIRSETDRGVIVFLDKRFTWSSYKKAFPMDWEFVVTENPEDLIREFF